MCCLNKQLGKRSTILLQERARMGQILIAQKICELVGNLANVNYPFNDCCNKNIIWIEKAGNLGQQVQQFQAIISGQSIRLDQKGNGSKSTEPTFAIMCGNEDITILIIGYEMRPKHSEPIKHRFVNVRLNKTLDGRFGLKAKKYQTSSKLLKRLATIQQ